MLAPGIIEAFGLYVARSSAMIVSAPIIGTGTRFSSYKIGLILSIALLMYGVTGEPLPLSEPLLYIAMVLREVLIGLFLSFVLHMAMLAVRVAGQLIGHEMGFMIAAQVDPATGIRTPLITSLYESMFVLAMLALNGHFLLFQGLAASFEHAPIGAIAFDQNLGAMTGRMFGDMFEAGLVFAAPIMVLLFLVSLMIGLLSRAVPHLNVLELGFAIRILLALMVMFAFAPLLSGAMHRIIDDFGRGLEQVIVVMKG